MTATEMNDGCDREARALRRAEDIPKVDAERVEQIRARIRDGSYTADAVLRATARAILERGDLGDTGAHTVGGGAV